MFTHNWRRRRSAQQPVEPEQVPAKPANETQALKSLAAETGVDAAFKNLLNQGNNMLNATKVNAMSEAHAGEGGADRADSARSQDSIDKCNCEPAAVVIARWTICLRALCVCPQFARCKSRAYVMWHKKVYSASCSALLWGISETLTRLPETSKERTTWLSV